MKKIIGVLAISVIILVVIQKSFMSDNSEPRGPEPQGPEPQGPEVQGDVVKVGYLAIAAALPIFVAEEEGFFAAHGINVELVEFQSSNEIAAAAAAREIDFIGIGATNAVLDVGFDADQIFSAVLLNGYTKGTTERKPTDYLLARTGVDLQNLKGKKVAFFPGTISRVVANIVLPKYGLTVDDIQYIEMPPPEWQPALATGAIDAVNAVEPFATQILNEEEAHPLIKGYYAEVMPDAPLSGAWFLSGHLSKSQELAIYKSLNEAVDFINADNIRATQHFDHYTNIHEETFSQIGLNHWQVTTEAPAADRLIKFANILQSKQAIKGIKGTIIWQKPM